MTIGTTTALGLIKGALRRINSYQSGEQLAQYDETDCLETLNDLLDSLSLERAFVFGSNEWILSWTAQKRIYTVGNPSNAVLSGANNVSAVGSASSPTVSAVWPNIVGTLTSGSPTITGVTSIPANLVAGSAAAYQVGSGSILSDFQNLIPTNTTVTAVNSGAQTITMSANATGSSNGADSISYTVPGDLPIIRPLRITHGFTRFSNLDFTLDVYETESQYNSILYKAQPGPWPTVAWYNNQFPYGVLNAYQTPGNSAELHLFTDTILANLTLNQVISMPQGYSRALKWLLAKEICAEYGVPMSESVKLNAAESMKLITGLNAQPVPVMSYDRNLSRGNRFDAGWILRGGY
jgi:hypothetical protein